VAAGRSARCEFNPPVHGVAVFANDQGLSGHRRIQTQLAVRR